MTSFIVENAIDWLEFLMRDFMLSTVPYYVTTALCCECGNHCTTVPLDIFKHMNSLHFKISLHCNEKNLLHK